METDVWVQTTGYRLKPQKTYERAKCTFVWTDKIKTDFYHNDGREGENVKHGGGSAMT